VKLKIEIKLDNAAFQPWVDPAPDKAVGGEVACILRKIADRFSGCILTPGDSAPVQDSNGNTCGTAIVVK
jgi:hypothetical protein